MKIAFVYDLIYPYSKGGVEKRISDLSGLLSMRGHEVHVLGMKYWDGEPNRVVEGVTFHGICEPTEIHAKGGTRSVWQAIRFAVAAGRTLAREEFEVVEVQGMAPLTCLFSLAACRFSSSTPLVTWYEVWRGYWHEYRGPLGAVGRVVEWFVARLGPAHAAVSRLAVSRLKEWGVHPVAWLPIGIDYHRIQTVPPAPLGSDLLYVGRLARHKNLELLIDAVSLLQSEGLRPIVSIVGEGPEREALERRAAYKGLSNVRFLGRVETDDQVFSLMKSARVFAFPSLREGFGLAPLEASACGLPVVAVSHPDNATSELVEHRVTGVLTSSNVDDFAKGLRELLMDPELRDSMSQAAMRSAESFDWAHIVDRVEQVYDQVPGSRRGRR